MGNKIEVVGGVKGEWRKVTKAEEVKVGQRVWYECFGKRGYVDDDPRFVKSVDGYDVDVWDGSSASLSCRNLFDVAFHVQAFFPIAEKKPRKVAKVEVFSQCDRWIWRIASIGTATVLSRYEYSSRKASIRGARRFCKTIGFECEIVK